jgi:hypothetical protein
VRSEKRSKDFDELRATYQELNSEMLRYLHALSNYLYLIRSDHCGGEARETLNSRTAAKDGQEEQ